MAERRTLGEILMGFGRIDEDDCARALEYQREHGGYFGEALLALGYVSREELEWSLASQFDLPYVFPDADTIDPEAAALVAPEWALANGALPIMRTDRTITVVVDSPVRSDLVEELQARTGLEVELALASPAHIRELIRQVFARGTVGEEEAQAGPTQLAEGLSEALSAGARRFGISTRGHRAWIWWDHAGTVRRRPLEGLWEPELDQILEPSAGEASGEGPRVRWEGSLRGDGKVTPVEVRLLSDDGGREYLFRPMEPRPAPRGRFPVPSPGLASEIRILARSGSARFVVTAEPSDLGRRILPHLPGLLFDPSWRSVHVQASGGVTDPEVFTVQMPAATEAWGEELDALRAFHFDAVSAELPGHPAQWVGDVVDVAAAAFVLWSDELDRKPALDAGVRWELRVVQGDGDRVDWTLAPLRP